MPNPDSKHALKVGVLADSKAQLLALRDMLGRTGYDIVVAVQPEDSSLPLTVEVDVWVVHIEEHSEKADQLLDWLDDQNIPMLIDDGDHVHRSKNAMLHDAKAESTAGEKSENSDISTPLLAEEYARWLATKIDACIANNKEKRWRFRAPEFVWVLAASTGGPEAVGQFFRHLSTLGIAAKKSAFIYAQHTDQRALSALMDVVRRQSELHVEACYSGQTIEAGHVYVPSPEKAFEINGSKQFVVTGRKWQGRYLPSINQIIVRVARAYREQSGAIIFTGMGDDGTDAVRLMRAAGGTIFVQDAESCVVDSMPKSAMASGCACYQGDIPSLAKRVDQMSNDFARAKQV